MDGYQKTDSSLYNTPGSTIATEHRAQPLPQHQDLPWPPNTQHSSHHNASRPTMTTEPQLPPQQSSGMRVSVAHSLLQSFFAPHSSWLSAPCPGGCTFSWLSILTLYLFSEKNLVRTRYKNRRLGHFWRINLTVELAFTAALSLGYIDTTISTAGNVTCQESDTDMLLILYLRDETN